MGGDSRLKVDIGETTSSIWYEGRRRDGGDQVNACHVLLPERGSRGGHPGVLLNGRDGYGPFARCQPRHAHRLPSGFPSARKMGQRFITGPMLRNGQSQTAIRKPGSLSCRHRWSRDGRTGQVSDGACAKHRRTLIHGRLRGRRAHRQTSGSLSSAAALRGAVLVRRIRHSASSLT